MDGDTREDASVSPARRQPSALTRAGNSFRTCRRWAKPALWTAIGVLTLLVVLRVLRKLRSARLAWRGASRQHPEEGATPEDDPPHGTTTTRRAAHPLGDAAADGRRRDPPGTVKRPGSRLRAIATHLLGVGRSADRVAPADHPAPPPGPARLATDGATIFVAVPCVEGETRAAALCVGRLFDNARSPARVRVGVLVRGSSGADAEAAARAFREAYRSTNRHQRGAHDAAIRVLGEAHADARGLSNALHMIATHLHRGELYAMTLRWDRLVCVDWDALAVEQLARCERMQRGERTRSIGWCDAAGPATPTAGTFPVLTQPACTAVADAGRGRVLPAFLRFAAWSEYGAPILEGTPCSNPPVRPLPSPFWTWGLSFCRASVWRAVPWDPWLEHVPGRVAEWVHSARMWTSGCDFFLPAVALSAPLDSVAPVRVGDGGGVAGSGHALPPYPPAPAGEVPTAGGSPAPPEAEPGLFRAWCLLGMAPAGLCDLTGYGLGTRRSLSTFAELTGVDPARRALLPHARVGMVRTDGVHPFSNDDVVACYGSWTAFYGRTGYPPPPSAQPGAYA